MNLRSCSVASTVRSRSPARSSCSRCSSPSVRLRLETSNMTPWWNRGRPASSRTSAASSRTHTVRPSFARIRYSVDRGAPVSRLKASAAR